jgi:hypothetical protein
MCAFGYSCNLPIPYPIPEGRGTDVSVGVLLAGLGGVFINYWESVSLNS